jgi:GT2 family glycosyltransferase
MPIETFITTHANSFNHVASSPQHEPPLHASKAALVSILIPCCGQLEHTKLLIPSLLRHSRRPFELVFLDVGSLDGTYEFLCGVAAATTLRVEVVRTISDVGLPVAVRETVDRAHGDYLVLVNNDTVVTDAWLDQLVSLANISPSVGLVGPVSNYASPPQLVEKVPYRLGPRKGTPPLSQGLVVNTDWDMDLLGRFAREWREQHAGKWMETESLSGFCLLIKRQVIDKIGPFEAEAGLSLFDTYTLCRKARQAGFTLAVCRDLYIHHFGTRTFAQGGPALAPNA